MHWFRICPITLWLVLDSLPGGRNAILPVKFSIFSKGGSHTFLGNGVVRIYRLLLQQHYERKGIFTKYICYGM